MRVLVVPVGSAGDVHPFVGVALALRDRGHEVRVITNPHFAPLLHRVALPLVPFGTTDQFDTLTAHPHLWHQVHGLGVIGAAVGLGIPELYRLVEQEVARGADVVVAGALAFGARIAHETSEFPLVTLHLQPTCFWSLEESPVLAPWLARINSCPRPLKRLVFTLSDQFADRVMAPATNRFRVELGLTPVRHIVSQWWHSPQRVIGLFPDWFASPQPDWPPQTALTGFPLYDERGTAEVPTDLDAFLSEAEAVGDPPVVFAPGSGNRQAARFFAAAVDGCRRLGRRGLLLTRYAEQLPSSLPATVRHFDYAPFSSVLPRASALVHHGGIGTAAQALAAGRPHLVMPMTFDQPDNALRLARLGVGRVLRPARFTGAAVARELDALLGSSDVERRCAEIAGRFHGADPRARTCELIEAMG